MLTPIPDHLRKNLSILFVGFNPSICSSETGHHFANPNNRFWKILHEANLTPRKLLPEEDRQLLEFGYGLTNIVSRPTKEAAEITKVEYEQGRKLLFKKISFYKPKLICFVGKGVYQEFSKQKKVNWGLQENSVTDAFEFVAPSSSGLVRMKQNEIVEIYSRIHNVINADEEE
ncbi:G/U mismatch-specific DNA glycosylase [Aquibacillus halophilus]|uniref:G/U mismatch-specific DNA glycosylase n=1 Tax=Aquibacillus halophilus TaxID=930132 RepID=A0A6A8DK06_9BACI|nr:G/U mismatch-specific DNA glycosylase [Aquibacillus halophilus]MRH44091.1 G/U mismatch-specific DNA glycosylase [Aquibacillus halophilus]